MLNWTATSQRHETANDNDKTRQKDSETKIVREGGWRGAKKTYLKVKNTHTTTRWKLTNVFLCARKNCAHVSHLAASKSQHGLVKHDEIQKKNEKKKMCTVRMARNYVTRFILFSSNRRRRDGIRNIFDGTVVHNLC